MSDTKLFSSLSVTPPDIVEGIVREGQLVTLAGSYSVGKSPLLQELAVCIINGIPFFGRKVLKRPVVYFDMENAGYAIEQNMRNICDRRGLDYPTVPDELEPYFLHGGTHSDSGSEQLIQLMKLKEVKDCLLFLVEILSRKPNAFIIIDPFEMFFKIDTIRKIPILELYGDLREQLARFPQAAMNFTFNLRKADRQTKKPDLLRAPRPWMEEVCGSLDIINRADVRIGMDFLADEEDMRAINGVRRGENFEPMVVKSVGEPGSLSGFTLCTGVETDLLSALSLKQKQYWEALPASFTMEEVRDVIVPHSALYRLIEKAKSLGIIEKSGKVWTKGSGVKVRYAKLLPEGF